MAGLKKMLAVGVLAAGLLAACSPGDGAGGGDARAFAGALDFTLVNFTGVTIRSVYISPHDSAGWEEDVLGRDILLNGGTVSISFSPEEQAVRWDLRVEDPDGNNAEWRNLNLREISKVTLRLSGDRKAVIAEAE